MTIWAHYKAPNLGLLFYKRLYEETKNLLKSSEDKLVYEVDPQKSQFLPYYEDLYRVDFDESRTMNNVLGNSSFSLMTVYPGLLVGSGYAHSTKTKGDATIGFYFDHTFGFPVIPGSSVKGVLRSLFEMDTDEKNGNEKTGIKSTEAIRFILNNIIKRHPQKKERFSELAANLNESSLEQLKIQIFGSQEEDGTDIFFDAWINLEKSPEKHFLGEDFITPHHPDLLKNPTPLQFLKVLPNVVFGFQFQLKDCELLSSEEKSLVFEEILLTLGIGAKTNVGYGQFIEFKPKGQMKNTTSSIQQLKLNEGVVVSAIKVGNILDAEIVNLSGGITIDLHIKDISFKPRLIGVSSSGFRMHQIIKVKVDQIGRQMKFSLAD